SVTARYHERIEEHTGPDGWYLDPARCGGGCLADNGPNAYDLVRLLLGDCRVTAADLRRDKHGIDRQAIVSLQAESGAVARIELDWSYPGECKDVEVRLADGTVHRVDLLAGHDGFKASLWHEYIGVLTDFDRVLSGPSPDPDPGLSALAFVTSAYRKEISTVEA
ncbi:MAG: Gfo/Idh/MocA family protein, partial [Stackebrandtia sp.]